MLSKDLIQRFGRQMLVPGIGLPGQNALHQGSVLIVGMGGLGSPASLYLAAAGVGRLGIVDYDVVEEHNLHRQVVHREASVGKSKVASARETLNSLNRHVQVDAHETLFGKELMDVVGKYDVVLDASDNAVTRYALNDACILHGKPLVSGAALRWEGHVTTYNYGGGPCYRCLYPQAPPPEAVTNCDAGGIAGPITGCIGSMQAMEAMNILMGRGPSYSGRMLCMMEGGEFRVVKLRGKQPSCLCSQGKEAIQAAIDGTSYETFCSSKANDKTRSLSILAPDERITVHKLNELSADDFTLLDVRPRQHFGICSIAGSINVPLVELLAPEGHAVIPTDKPIYVICRRGNDSQIATRLLKSRIRDVAIFDVIGGVADWARFIDTEMPIY